MLKLFSMLCCLAMLSTQWSWASTSDPLETARDYMAKREYQKAVEWFDVALKSNGRDWKILQSRANCQMRLGNNEVAVADLKRSIEVGGLHASQCAIMAAALEGLGQPKQAVAWLQLAGSIDPQRRSDPAMQEAIRRLVDPHVNSNCSPDSPDYLSGLTSAKGWERTDLPLRVHIRKNIQLPSYHTKFAEIVTRSLDEWCKATGGSVTYVLVESSDKANLVCDYTDRHELVSSGGEPGLDGNLEMLVKATSGCPSKANVVVLVRDNPQAPLFRDSRVVEAACLHEMGHVLGMHGHSANNHDVMFLATNPKPILHLSARDINTIRKMYSVQIPEKYRR